MTAPRLKLLHLRNGDIRPSLAGNKMETFMIKRLLIGAVLGVLGKKLYDEGKLDPYIAKAKAKLDESGVTGASAKPGSPTS